MKTIDEQRITEVSVMSNTLSKQTSVPPGRKIKTANQPEQKRKPEIIASKLFLIAVVFTYWLIDGDYLTGLKNRIHLSINFKNLI